MCLCFLIFWGVQERFRLQTHTAQSRTRYAHQQGKVRSASRKGIPQVDFVLSTARYILHRRKQWALFDSIRHRERARLFIGR